MIVDNRTIIKLRQQPMVTDIPATMLNGLILSGGKSTRMGTAKELIQWHGKEHCYYLADLLMAYCTNVFISARTEQSHNFNSSYKIIIDRYDDIGPMSGILSAFQHQPSAAWLVLACDFPLLNHETISYLVESRDKAKPATAFLSPVDGLPEPLLAIWEAASYPLLLKSLENRSTSLRKMLLSNEINLLQAITPESLINANTPEDATLVQRLLNAGKK